MFMSKINILLVIIGYLILSGCTANESNSGFQLPKEIIDLGALVTEDLPERVWGKMLMSANGFDRSNNFDVINFEFELNGEQVNVSNSYFTIFNHGGPHVDAPNHIGVGQGIDNVPIESFTGPLKVFDVSGFPKGRSIPPEIFKGSIDRGDIVIIYTNFTPFLSSKEFPETITLTREAAEYLATFPISAFGTDAFHVECLPDTSSVDVKSATATVAPIHHSFLSRNIPVYEQLFHVEQLVDKDNMYFVGVPLNIKDGDGMIVRPVVLTY